MAGVGKRASHLSPPDCTSGLPTPAASIPLEFFGAIMNDPYAEDFPAAMLAAVRWSYVPVTQIGSYAVVPNQRDGRNLRSEVPEFRLLVAVLDDAVTIIQDGRQRYARNIPFPKDSLVTGELEFYDAVRWVMGLYKTKTSHFAFEWVCDALDLDPDIIRDELLYGSIENCTMNVILGMRKVAKHYAASTRVMARVTQ